MTIRLNPLVTHRCALLLRLVVLVLALGPTGALAFRSTLYPTNWTSPTVASANLQNDKLIQDFSYAGYRAGEQPIPNVVGPIFNVTLPPYNADNTGVTNATVAIQSAINAAQSAGGGVVLLPAGLYSISPQGANSYALQINAANVVLRGAGTNSTFLLNTSTNMRSKSIILMTGPSAAGFYSSGAASTTISQDLLGPTREIPVTSTSGFAIGQWVVVRADCTDAWITEHGEPDWIGYGSNLRGVAYFRRVVGVSAVSNTITINAPTRYYLKTRDNARVVRLGSAPLLNCGLEDLSIGNAQHNGSGWGEDDYSTPGTGGYDAHDSFAVRIVRARDSWVRNVATFQPTGNTTTAHLLSNGILISECSQLTLANVNLARTQYGGGGGNGYLYRLQNANDCLLDNCRATFTRHGFVLSHMASSGNVYHGCTDKDTGRQTGDTGSQSTGGANSDHHMHFSHANLVDACTADGSGFEARYRPYGSAPLHNLTAAHSVFWNTRGIGSGPSYAVQSEQSRYGYVIGTRGTRTGVSLSTYGGIKCNPADHVEGMAQGDSLEPSSLYEDQLKRRLGLPAISLPAAVHLGFPTNSIRLQPFIQIGSEEASTNQYSAVWKVISAPGQILFSNSNSPNPLVTFGDRGTNEVELTVTTTNNQQTSTRCRVVLLPSLSLSTESFTPVADTFVRDGTFANDSYGQDTALLLKKNATVGYTRYTYLRFHLAAATLTNFDQAFLELRTPSPPPAETAPTLELHFITNDAWSETNTTWNTQPAMGATLATWLMSTSGVDRVDVTGIVASEINGDALLSFGVLIATPFSDTVYSFGSREGTASRRPQLVLEASEPVSFADWIGGFTNLAPVEAGPASNPDGDRLNNGEEFLFVRNPSLAEALPAFSIVPAASGFNLTYAQRKNLPPDIYYVIETTLSLSPAIWQPAAGVEFSQVGSTDEAMLINAFVPAGVSQGFYRFRIVLGT